MTRAHARVYLLVQLLQGVPVDVMLLEGRAIRKPETLRDPLIDTFCVLREDVQVLGLLLVSCHCVY